MVQLDEPVLSEVVMTGREAPANLHVRGAGRAGRSAAAELDFAPDAPRSGGRRPAARAPGACTCAAGNWTPDERVALAGDYRPLLSFFSDLDVGALFLELATPRAGEIEVLGELPRRLRIGVGVVNQKREPVEGGDEVLRRTRRAVEVLGAERVLLTPDCGFATFADNPVASARAAEAALGHVARAAAVLRRG